MPKFTYLLLEASIKVINDTVTFHGDSVLVVTFSALSRAQNFPIGMTNGRLPGRPDACQGRPTLSESPTVCNLQFSS